MTGRPRGRRDPALLRGRYRTLFFAFVAVFAVILGHPGAAAPALAGVLVGVYSIRVARLRGGDLAHTFVAVDWLLLGVALALSGGADSWLLGAVPLLALGQLAGAPRREWPYLMAPALLLLIVLAIADPSLGGSRAAGVAKVAILAGGGWVAATRLQRRPERRASRQPHAPKVDVSTGLSTGACLPDFLERSMAEALATHSPLSVVYVRLQHYEDSRNFLGAEKCEELVRGVARRAERRVGSDGRVFRVRTDSLVLVLPDCSLSDARSRAAELGHDVSSGLIAGRRQTIAAGAASFPAVRDAESLLATAREDAQPLPAGAPAAVAAVPLAAAQ